MPRSGVQRPTSAERHRLGLPELRRIPPSLRTVIDRTDARRAAADAYARALVELHAARDFAESAYWSRDGAGIRRAIRWVAAANAVADLAYEALTSA